MKSSQSSVTLIDCDYVHPRFAAAYLMIEEDEAAFIENNTHHSVPRLLEELQRAGLAREKVRYVIVTHVHLDHSGGTGALMAACPSAQLLVHPRGARHMIDPSKLESSARAVYGDERFNALYGQLAPIDASRVRTVEDGETVSLGSRALRFLHTRGHANHHFCVYDPASDGIFTGDAFGLRYPDLQDEGLFIIPSTSPTDFIGIDARASIDRIVATGAKQAYLTHFGAVEDLPAAARQLHTHLDFSEALLADAVASSLPDAELGEFCRTRTRGYFESLSQARARPFTEHQWSILAMDIELNGDGIAHVARKQRETR